MKRKIIICLCMSIFISFILSTYSVNAECFDTDKISIYAAGPYNDEIATILFSDGELLYRGFINKKGKLMFYIEWNYQDDYDREFWNDLDWDFEGLNYTQFHDGYSWFDFGDNIYIINQTGEIVSSYQADKVLRVAGGYTWTITEEKTSWDNPGGYTYTLFRPDGEEETNLVYDFKGLDKWEVNEMEDELDGYTFYYRGEGVFSDPWDKYYFTKSGKWYEYDVPWNFDIKFENDKYTVFDYADQDDEQYPSFLMLVNSYGEVRHIDIPKLSFSWEHDPRVKGISENYVLFVVDDVFYIYNMESKKIKKYSGKFADYVYKSQTSTYAQISNDFFAFTMEGADDREYVGLVNNDNMEEVMDPVYIEDREDFSLNEDFLMIKNDTEIQIYDMKGNILTTFDHDKEISSIEDGIILFFSNDEKWAEYYNYNGTPLFDKYDFSNAVNLYDEINNYK